MKTTTRLKFIKDYKKLAKEIKGYYDGDVNFKKVKYSEVREYINDEMYHGYLKLSYKFYDEFNDCSKLRTSTYKEVFRLLKNTKDNK